MGRDLPFLINETINPIFQDSVLVVYAIWYHLIPFRTQKLNGLAQTIVVGQPTAKICHRQNNVLKKFSKSASKSSSFKI